VQQSVRYEGALPWRQLYTIVTSLHFTRSGTSSQWRSTCITCRITHLSPPMLWLLPCLCRFWSWAADIPSLLSHLGVLTRTSDICSTKQFSFEAVLEKKSVTNLTKMAWKTVPCSRSSMTEATLSEPGSAPRLDVDSCVGASETRSTAGMWDCLKAIGYI